MDNNDNVYDLERIRREKEEQEKEVEKLKAEYEKALKRKKEKDEEFKKLTVQKRGRPKTKGECTCVSLSLDLDMLKKIQIAKASFGENQTRYIQTAIQRDMDAHFEEYKKVFENRLQLLLPNS